MKFPRSSSKTVRAVDFEKWEQDSIIELHTSAQMLLPKSGAGAANPDSLQSPMASSITRKS
jgi:hypothetical protein